MSVRADGLAGAARPSPIPRPAGVLERGEDPVVLLLHMPLAVPQVPNLALHLLRGVLEREGLAAEVFYGTLCLHRTPVLDAFVHSVAGAAMFTPQLFPAHSAVSVRDALVGCVEVTDELRRSVARFASESADRGWDHVPWHRLGRAAAARHQLELGHAAETLEETIDVHMALAELCITDCLAAIPPGRHDIYGFSVMFDSQKVASLALARRLKQRDPDCTILFGGTGCDGAMGRELMRAFPWIDVVVQGDAELVVAPLVRALRHGAPLAGVPGLLYRAPRDAHAGGPIASTGAAPVPDLDDLPIPDYGDFLAQMTSSDWRGEQPFILFESSRGCWWGERHHCTFCGLRADGMRYRRKSPDRSLAEIEQLARRHPDHRVLYATDAILDHRYCTSFFPRARRVHERVPLRLFFEIKSNLRRRDVVAMAAAGVFTVQPGIESFSDRVLALMNKGVTGLRQVQLLKWLNACDVRVVYNFLLGTPGETAADYDDVVQLVDSLTHLSPPSNIGLLSLDRFSPYFAAPARHGMTRVRPDPAYAVQFPDPSIRLDDLAYRFCFDSPEQRDPELVAAWDRLRCAVARWYERHEGQALQMVDAGDAVVIIERRDGQLARHVVSGVAAQLYRFCDSCQGFGAIRRAFAAVADDALRGCLALWITRGWMARDARDVYLALAVPILDPAAADALHAPEPDPTPTMRVLP